MPKKNLPATALWIKLFGMAAAIIASFQSCGTSRTHGIVTSIDEKGLQASITRYQGVPYVYGGTTADGMDCSGFTSTVFRENGVLLPRTAAEQYQIGESIAESDLAMGDLVFFATGGSAVSHVGIYTANRRFAHASNTQGVGYSTLDEDYYRNSYVGAKRIINASWEWDEGGKLLTASEYPLPTPLMLTSLSSEVPQHRQIMANVGFQGIATQSSLHLGLWRWFEFAGFVDANNLVSSGTPSLRNPGGVAKLHVLAERSFLPEITLGYEHRKSTPVSPSDGNVDFSDPPPSIVRDGAFLAARKSYRRSSGFLLGRGDVVASINQVWGFAERDWKRGDVSLGLRQQVFSRILLMGELPSLRNPGLLAAGLQLAVTRDTALTLLLNNALRRDLETWGERSRELRFSFAIPF